MATPIYAARTSAMLTFAAVTSEEWISEAQTSAVQNLMVPTSVALGLMKQTFQRRISTVRGYTSQLSLTQTSAVQKLLMLISGALPLITRILKVQISGARISPSSRCTAPTSAVRILVALTSAATFELRTSLVLMSRTLRCLTLNTTTPGCRAEGSTSRNGLRLTSPVRGQRMFQIRRKPEPKVYVMYTPSSSSPRTFRHIRSADRSSFMAVRKHQKPHAIRNASHTRTTKFNKSIAEQYQPSQAVTRGAGRNRKSTLCGRTQRRVRGSFVRCGVGERSRVFFRTRQARDHPWSIRQRR
jgi:hypothetical protein